MTQAAGRRYAIRYATQRWDDGKWFYGGFFIILLGLTLFKVVRQQSILSFIPVLVVDGAILIGFYLLRLVSYVEVGQDSLRIRYVFRQVTLPYSAVSKVRRQPLEVAFQPAERRRFVNRFVRRLARQPAAYIRLDRRQGDLLALAERRLGARLVAAPDVVIPIADVDGFINELKGRLRPS